jgi:hypothetical protein
MHPFIAPAEEGKGRRKLLLRIQERFGSPALGVSLSGSASRSGKSRLASSGWRTRQLRYPLQFASSKSCSCIRVSNSGCGGYRLHSWPNPIVDGWQFSVCPTCPIELGGVRVHCAPAAVNSHPRAPEKSTSRFGQAGTGVACKAWPNPPVNLTRNGVRQSAAEVSCAHCSSPAACRTPLRSGYRQR